MLKQVKLKDVAIHSKGKQINNDALIESGLYDYLNGGINPSGKWHDFNTESNTVTISEGGNSSGYVNFMTRPFWCGAHCYYLYDVKIQPKYLYYALKSQECRLMSLRTGSTMPNIKKSTLAEFSFQIDSDPNSQKQIESILDIISELIFKKNQQLAEYDQLVKSRFNEMFSELDNTVKLEDCCEVHARIGWQALTKSEHMNTGDYLLITGTDFRDNEVNYTDCKFITKERFEMDHKIILRNDDILITKDGTIGKVAIVNNLPKPATLNSGIFVVRPDNRFNKDYISFVFRGPLFETFVEKKKTGATIKHLNQGHLNNFEIPLPLIEEQVSFAEFSNHVYKLKAIVQQSLNETQQLFDSLMQEYFG